MRIQTVVIMALALICGVAAVVAVNQLVKPGKAEPAAPTFPIVIVTRDVERGSLLTSDDLRIENVLKVPPKAATTIDSVLGRPTLVRLSAGDFISDAKLGDKGSGGGLAAMIPKGMRAFTIQAPHSAAGGGGFIMPESHVDVLQMSTNQNSSDVDSTIPLLQDIEVLAVDQLLDAPASSRIDPKEIRTVTLLVTPGQASILAQAQARGVLHLTLRNPADADIAAAAQEAVFPAPELPPVQSEPIASVESGETKDDAESDAKPAVPPKQMVRWVIVTVRGAHQGQIELQREVTDEGTSLFGF